MSGEDRDDAELIRVAPARAGFEESFQTVGDPATALRYLEGQREYADRTKFPFPHLILLDHKMPGDGWEVIEWVRAQPKLELLPVVVFSGSDDPNHQKKALELGANAYHVKPQSFERFTATVKRICEFWLRGHSGLRAGGEATSP